MPNIEEVVRKYEDLIIPVFTKKIQEIDEKINSLVFHLIQEKKELEFALESLKAGEPHKIIFNNERPLNHLQNLSDEVYKQDMPKIDKAIFILKRNGELTLNEIALKIQEREPNIDFAALKNGLSVVFAQDVNKEIPKFKRRRNENNKWVYDIERN